ncbi:hypothetical protein [Aquidulcibacter sp.]|uniref:hypothetical protein n=1 Tax=Aquidulcibacter sp. TaxID=2052990 RepID=UPI0025C34518|nr:hypothetical protein [Aquidulcibacter sp.]MCA3695302.1 hypothetical protein [Aquidulcibacter sp.]
MMDASIKVDRGADQSILCNVWTNESLASRLNLMSKPLRAFIRVSEDVPVAIEKVLRVMDAATGLVALDLTRTESRLIPIGNKMQIEIKLYDGSSHIIVGRGRVTGFGGITLDT